MTPHPSGGTRRCEERRRNGFRRATPFEPWGCAQPASRSRASARRVTISSARTNSSIKPRNSSSLGKSDCSIPEPVRSGMHCAGGRPARAARAVLQPGPEELLGVHAGKRAVAASVERYRLQCVVEWNRPARAPVELRQPLDVECRCRVEPEAFEHSIPQVHSQIAQRVLRVPSPARA